jgi:shikimate kinase
MAIKRLINVFLIGPMGAGKSTIGRYIAKELKMDFCDTDQEIEARTGANIAWVFDVEGEEGFRKREMDMIAELTQKQHIVLATGGGAIVAPENRQRLAARGTVVYLHTTVAQQMRRISCDKRRPQVQKIEAEADNLEEAFLNMMAEREPLYREIADMTVATDGRTVRAVALDVIRMCERGDR